MLNRTHGLLLAAAFGAIGSALVSGCWHNGNGDDALLGNGDHDSGATFTQVDRMGIPTLNTVFNHPSPVAGFSKPDYNRASPEDDLASYQSRFETVLGAVRNEDPEAATEFLLPDELPVKLGTESDFAQLNGRRLQDDAVDIALFLVVGDSLAALHSDHVDANDVAFMQEFPYLAAPH